jgi:hypothetical protein
MSVLRTPRSGPGPAAGSAGGRKTANSRMASVQNKANFPPARVKANWRYPKGLGEKKHGGDPRENKANFEVRDCLVPVGGAGSEGTLFGRDVHRGRRRQEQARKLRAAPGWRARGRRPCKTKPICLGGWQTLNHVGEMGYGRKVRIVSP